MMEEDAIIRQTITFNFLKELISDPLLESARDMASVFTISFDKDKNCPIHREYVKFLAIKEEERRKIEEQTKIEIKKKQDDYVLQMKLQRERERLIALSIKKQQQI